MLTRLTILLLTCASLAIAAEPLARLKVADDHRTLITADGKPWVYLGDTAWELFHRLNREDADAYLTDRASKGFNVIQAVALAEFGGLVEPNAYGHLPLENNDPTKPLEPYFQHVDYIVDKAASLGMRVGFLPTWGDKVNRKWGEGPEIFTPVNARILGEWLGRRYKDKPIIWIVGGDRPVLGRVPDQTLLVSDLGDGAAHCQALRGADSSWAIIYSASGRSFSVVLGNFPAKKLNAAWFDPRTGKKLVPATITNDSEPREFTPPTSGDAQDWVLLLDTAS